MGIIQNKTGSIYSIILIAFMIFVVGMIIVNFITPEITTARTQLNCDDSTITDGAKLLCLNVDISLVYFILLVLSLTVGVITDKFLI